MDLEMPVMDGLTAVKHIRAEEAAGTLSSNQVIALSKYQAFRVDWDRPQGSKLMSGSR